MDPKTNNNSGTTVVAIDDDQQFHKSLKRLNRYRLNCKPIFPPSDSDFQVSLYPLLENADVVLIDYRLDDQSADGSHPASYRGGMVAAAIRDRFPLYPIVLVTTEEKHHEYVQNNPRIALLFDYLLLKSKLTGKPRDRKASVEAIISLAEGFKQLGRLRTENHVVTDGELAELLQLEKEEMTLLEDRVLTPLPREPAEIGRWLLQELLRFRGPLLDKFEVAAKLGITLKSLEQPRLMEWLVDAEYQGPFRSLERLWWETRLTSKLIGPDGGSVASSGSPTRAAAVARQSGLEASKIKPGKCSYCKGALVSRACSVCRDLTDSTHCLSVNRDSRPRWSLPDIVCFRCIETGRDQELKFGRFDPRSQDVAEIIRSGSSNE